MPIMPVPEGKEEGPGIWECRKCGHTFTGGVWEPFTRASDANNRVVRRSMEGATATDMAVIAQQALGIREKNCGGRRSCRLRGRMREVFPCH